MFSMPAAVVETASLVPKYIGKVRICQSAGLFPDSVAAVHISLLSISLEVGIALTAALLLKNCFSRGRFSLYNPVVLLVVQVPIRP